MTITIEQNPYSTVGRCVHHISPQGTRGLQRLTNHREVVRVLPGFTMVNFSTEIKYTIIIVCLRNRHSWVSTHLTFSLLAEMFHLVLDYATVFISISSETSEDASSL